MTEQAIVLIVDDERDVSEILAYSLRREGFRVLTAGEAAEGIAVARAERPDVVLLDVMMPGITGWEMLDRMRTHDATRNIPVVMCTVLAEPRFLEKAAASSAAGYIRKPFKPEAVVRTIRGVLSRGVKRHAAPDPVGEPGVAVTLVLRADAVIDGTGADPHPGAVAVAGEAIRAAGPDVAAAAGDEVLDLEGCTLLPGLIDAHTHLGLVDLAGTGTVPLAVVAGEVFRNCELALRAGFTSARDCGGVDGGLARAIDMGLVAGPRLFPSGPILCQTGGHGDTTPPWAVHPHGIAVPGLVHQSLVCDGPDEVRVAARTVLRHGATQVKVCVSGGVVSLSDSIEDTQFTVDELCAAVEEARARDTYVTAHAHNIDGIRNGLAAGVSCFEHGSFLDEATAAAMASAGASLVPTLAVARVMAVEWRRWGLTEEILGRMAGVEDAMARSVKLAHDAGVRIGSGSDLLGTEQNRHGLELVLKAQILGPMEAIVSATSMNAAIMGVADRLGTIGAGKTADLVAVDGDPLAEPELFDDPDRVVLVVKGGRVVKDARA